MNEILLVQDPSPDAVPVFTMDLVRSITNYLLA
jgi:hypothetical protein